MPLSQRAVEWLMSTISLGQVVDVLVKPPMIAFVGAIAADPTRFVLSRHVYLRLGDLWVTLTPPLVL